MHIQEEGVSYLGVVVVGAHPALNREFEGISRVRREGDGRNGAADAGDRREEGVPGGACLSVRACEFSQSRQPPSE